MILKKDEKSGWVKEILFIEDLENAINILIKQILDSKIKFHYIYAIPRGGLVIGVWLSHRLNIPLVSDHNSLSYIAGPILVVDDIADTGKTLLKYQQSRYKLATLYYKKRSIVKPHFYAEETENWIVFPWECEEEETNRDL